MQVLQESRLGFEGHCSRKHFVSRPVEKVMFLMVAPRHALRPIPAIFDRC